MVLGLVYIVWPVGHIPLYDANLVRLAESDLQGYCSGDTFWKTGGVGDSNMASECRSRLAKKHSSNVDLSVVQGSFCQAIVDSGWTGTKSDCLGIMATNEYWPTYVGAITNQWNRARPYPKLFSLINSNSKSSQSRTGGHSGNQRSNNPSHEVPTYPIP